ncbi:MAG: nitronate monooxygenase [Gammaproteobacteria bacterium]|jgi:nitronate monooxygenase
MPLWPDSRLLDLLQVEHAIIQAPMAGSTTPALAAAVSNAGGMGSLGCAMMDPGAVHGQVTQLRSKTNRAFNLNFFCHQPPGEDALKNARAVQLLQPFYDEYCLGEVPAVQASNFPFDAAMLDLMLELRPPVVSFHFGAPEAALLAPLRAAGIVVLSSATCAREARDLQAMGVDAVIAQGFEAGGHRGHFAISYEASCIGTMALVPQIVDAVTIPVIAAGGIADGRGIAAALMLGASGVQLGTAFMSSDEASVAAVHRQAIANASEEDTRMTRAFSGRPARGIRNRYIDAMAAVEGELPDFPLMNTLTKPLRAASQNSDSGDLVSLYAGQALTLNRSMPAAQLLETLIDETGAALTRNQA